MKNALTTAAIVVIALTAYHFTFRPQAEQPAAEPAPVLEHTVPKITVSGVATHPDSLLNPGPIGYRKAAKATPENSGDEKPQRASEKVWQEVVQKLGEIEELLKPEYAGSCTACVVVDTWRSVYGYKMGILTSKNQWVELPMPLREGQELTEGEYTVNESLVGEVSRGDLVVIASTGFLFKNPRYTFTEELSKL